MRDLRTLVRHRAGLVRIRTSLKNRVHADKVAIVATARHLAESVYWVLAKRE